MSDKKSCRVSRADLIRQLETERTKRQEYEKLLEQKVLDEQHTLAYDNAVLVSAITTIMPAIGLDRPELREFAEKILSQPHPGDPLREELEQYRDGSHPNLVYREMGMCQKCHSTPIEFTETDGTLRRIVHDGGDPSVGIEPGWETDDNAYDNLQVQVERYKSFIEEQKRKCEVHFSCESCVIRRVAGCPIFEALNPQKEGA